MNALQIAQLTVVLLELTTKYMAIAAQNKELTPEETTAFKLRLQELFSSPAWQIDADPS